MKKLCWLALLLILLPQHSMATLLEESDTAPTQQIVKLINQSKPRHFITTVRGDRVERYPEERAPAHINFVYFQAPIRGTQESLDWLYHPDSGKFISPKGQVIEPWNQPKEIRDLRQQGYGLVTLHWLLESSFLRITPTSNGELTLYLSGRLRGGMMQGAQRALPIVEKGVDKLNRVVAPLIIGGLGALGIKGTQEALNQRRAKNAPPLDLMEHLERQQARQRQETRPQPHTMERQIPKPRSKPMSRQTPVPKTKPTHGRKPQTVQSKGHGHSGQNIYRPSIPKESVCKKKPIGIKVEPIFMHPPAFPSNFALSQVDSLIDQHVARQIREIYASWDIQDQVQKQLNQRAQTLEKKRVNTLQKLNLHTKNIPKEIQKLLKDLPLAEGLLKVHDDILAHPNALMTNFSKNTAPWANTPKQEAKLQTMMTWPGGKLKGIWLWGGKNFNWGKKESHPCNKRLTKQEKQYFFKYWNGDKKKHLGLLNGDDLLSLVKMERIGGKKSNTFAFTLKAKVVPNTIVNGEALKVLQYMGKSKIRFGKSPYTCDLNARGQFALKDHKRGIVFPPFLEDRKQTNDLLPTNYKSSQKDRDMGTWLIKRYWDSRLNLNQALTRGLGDSKVDPMHRVLAENRTTGSLHNTFGIVANTLGPGGFRKISLQVEKSDKDLSRLLDDAHHWLGLFTNPNKYFRLSMDRPISQCNGTILKPGALPNSVVKRFVKDITNYIGTLLWNSGTIQDPRNKLCYPFYSRNLKVPGNMLPRGYEPIKEHELLGEGFMRATGRYGQKILEEVLGIPRQAQASYAQIIASPVLKEGGKWLSTTVGFGLANMIDTKELQKRLPKYLRNAKDNLQIATKNFMEFVEWSAKKHQESFPIFDPQGPTFEGFPAFDGDKMKKFITWVANEDKSKILAMWGIERGAQILSTPKLDAGDIKRLIHMNVTKGDIEFAEISKISGGMRPAKKGEEEGVRWFDGKTSGIRIMNGLGDRAKHACQREDYVKILRDGHLRDKDGKPVSGGEDGFEKARDNPRTHIKKTEWRKWKHPLHPTDPTGGLKK